MEIVPTAWTQGVNTGKVCNTDTCESHIQHTYMPYTDTTACATPKKLISLLELSLLKLLNLETVHTRIWK